MMFASIYIRNTHYYNNKLSTTHRQKYTAAGKEQEPKEHPEITHIYNTLTNLANLLI